MKFNLKGKTFDIIKSSLYKGTETPSSSRIMSYIMMVIIFAAGCSAILIELVNAIMTWVNKETYTIPWEHITILGMWLTHQLTLLGIYKNSDKNRYQEMINQSKDKSTDNNDITEELPPE